MGNRETYNFGKLTKKEKIEKLMRELIRLVLINIHGIQLTLAEKVIIHTLPN